MSMFFLIMSYSFFIAITRQAFKTYFVWKQLTVFSIWKSLWVYKKLTSRLWPMLFTLTYFFLIHTLSCSAAKQKVLVQAFTSCMHGYDHKHNIHTSDVTCTRKSMDGIDSSVSKLFEFANLSGFLLFFFCPVLGWFYHVLLPVRP